MHRASRGLALLPVLLSLTAALFMASEPGSAPGGTKPIRDADRLFPSCRRPAQGCTANRDALVSLLPQQRAQGPQRNPGSRR